MAVLDFPNIPKPDAESWTLTFNTQTFTSDLNGAIQTAELPGARWSGTLTYTNRQGIDARRLRGFLAANRGRAGRFLVTPADAVLEGSATQNGIVGGGASLVLDFAGEVYSQNDWDAYSAPAGVTEIQASGFGGAGEPALYAGDYFEVNGELKICTDDYDGGTLKFSPPLRVGVSYGQTVRVINPRVRVMLTNDDQASWSVSAPVIYGVTFEVVEALDI
jgi:hypothetical protein